MGTDKRHISFECYILAITKKSFIKLKRSKFRQSTRKSEEEGSVVLNTEYYSTKGTKLRPIEKIKCKVGIFLNLSFKQKPFGSNAFGEKT